ncbi:MAG: ATP-binding protein [Treponema sp.]|nr:ATP-binding protein [Treponema sp.]
MRDLYTELMDLIEGEQYFLIHAARQSGKTTLLKALTRQLNAGGKYYALYCSLEAIEEFSDPDRGIPAIVKAVKSALDDYRMPAGFADNADYSDIAGVLKSSFSAYCRGLDKPLVVFFDEADCLSNGTLVTFLRQLRNGYVNRPDIPFIHSAALAGMRNLRDYKAQVRPDSQTLGTASPFNIVTEYISLRNFTRDEVELLYGQHTAETAQVFDPAADAYAFERTQGQPWLVNAIAREAVEKITKNDYAQVITKNHIEGAIQNIILARGTHFDSLIRKLREPRIRKIIAPLITGEEIMDRTTDDYLYARDLGLISEVNGKTEAANPIYAEIIIKALNQGVQDSIENTYKEYCPPRYIKDGKIDMDFLIKDFQNYWRENSEIWKTKYQTELYQYDEAAPHLVLQAFLQRVINSGGRIIREMALGTKRADLCVLYGEYKYPVELKLLHNIRNYADSLNQISGYADKCGSDSGWLVIFDRDADKPWDEKIYTKEEKVNGKRIFVAGC